MEKEKEKNEQTSQCLVSLKDVYLKRDEFQLYIANQDKSKLKHVLTGAVKDFENEVSLLDILTGVEESTIDEKVFADIRGYYKIVRQSGFNPAVPYDFQFKKDRDMLRKISEIRGIQKTFDNSITLREF